MSDQVMNLLFSEYRPLRPVITEAITSARTDILVLHCFLRSGGIVAALEAAALRGVRVEVLTEKTDPKIIDRLRESKIEVTRFIPDAGRRKMHHKMIVIDRERVLIGSVNLFDRSLDTDGEDLVRLISKDLAERCLDEYRRVLEYRGLEDRRDRADYRDRTNPRVRQPGKRRRRRFAAGLLVSSLLLNVVLGIVLYII